MGGEPFGLGCCSRGRCGAVVVEARRGDGAGRAACGQSSGSWFSSVVDVGPCIVLFRGGHVLEGCEIKRKERWFNQVKNITLIKGAFFKVSDARTLYF